MKNGGKRPGAGRKRGTLNKTTALLKDAILKAAEQAGGKGRDGGLVGYLKIQAVESPGPFMALLGKVLPMQIANDGSEAFKVAMEVSFVNPGDKGKN